MFTFRFALCFGRFSYSFLIWKIYVWFVCHYWTLTTYYLVFFSCFLKIFTWYFLFLSTVNKQEIFFRLLAYPLQVSSAIECLKVTLNEAVYYFSYSLETETEKFMNRSFVLVNKI